MRPGAALALALALVLGGTGAARAQGAGGGYFGTELGALSELHHGVRGRVYAVDSRTLYLRDFHYDGEGPAAFFYVGSSAAPSGGGVRLRDERGGTGALRRYRGEGVTLALPDGTTLRDVRWFSVWCDEYSVNFGDVVIPRDGEWPRPAKLGALRGVHGVSSDALVVVDAQTLLLPNFSYDGGAPDAKFWVGRGEKPSPAGIRIPDENGKEGPLRKYDRKTIVLTLPGELTVFDIGHFGVWCEAFTVNFGHVALPPALVARVPPSLKMLGVSPQSKLNCEVLHDELAFEVRWAVAGDSIVLQLVAKLEDGEYMSFGVSGDARHSQMVGADVAVAWVDKHSLKGYAVDYYLDAKSQCAGVRGSCPDERLGEKTNSVRLLNAALVNGYSIVTYQRSLRAADELDRAVVTNASQPVVWALGPLNARNEVSYHHHFTKGDRLVEFGRPPVWNCPMPESEEEHEHHAPAAPAAAPAHRAPQHKPADDNRAAASPAAGVIKPNPVPTPAPAPKAVPWDIPAIQCHEPPDGVFYAQMGPTGGKQGYPAITGHVGWGISWYINGLLIPEVSVVRGRKYTFVVEGGSDPDVPARYHPFYITNDPVGGYYHKTDDEKKGVEIYAGVRRSRSGAPVPTGVGRLCNWTPDAAGPEADEFPSFGAYQRSLTLVCEEGSPGVVTWTPDRNTPDTVYYQCFTHRYLGWKINVVDSCEEPAEGEAQESRVAARVARPDDLEQEESVQVHSRVKPDSNFIDQRRKTEKIINTKTNYNDFSSDKGGVGHAGDAYRPRPDRHQHPHEFDMPISNGQIRDVIQAVESLESRMREGIQRNASEAAPHRTAPPARPPPAPYQVHEEVRESFLPERPLREGDEYDVEAGRAPEHFFLPHGQRPLTLQSVLRPGAGAGAGGGPGHAPHAARPHFRRPVPPEIKLRRPPPPMFLKNNNGFPLPMPNVHGPQGMSKNKPPYNRMPSNTNRSPPGPPPMKSLPPLHHPKPVYNQGPPKQVPKIPSGPVQSIIMGKPNVGNIQLPSQSQTLSLGRTDLIANKVVKSQITLPGSNDAIAQASVPSSVMFTPGQIILGKPMDNPVPLDQQMTQTRHQIMRIPNTLPTPSPESQPTPQGTRPGPMQSYGDIQSSDFMGESTDTSSIPPAVNTGFRPNTIVIESGFKPIIREPLMDRVGDFDDGSTNNNRREDTDVAEDYDQSPQYISNHAYHTPSDKITETFEPMFIPSPPDHLQATNHKTTEVFPSNHAKEDRPHPVYVKTESEMNTLFSKENMNKDVPSDMVMESDIVSPQYLPPDPKLPKDHSQKLSSNDETFTTYDGKTVSAATLTSVPDSKPVLKLFSSKLPANTELLLKSPQFGPFKGDIPPPLDAHVSKDSSREPGSDNRTTHLKLVNVYTPDEVEYELKAEGSDLREVTADSEYEHDELGDDTADGDHRAGGEDTTRTKRDTKTAQFERGEVEEQTTSKSKNDTINQMEFQSKSGVSRPTHRYWANLVLLPALCLKIF